VSVPNVYFAGKATRFADELAGTDEFERANAELEEQGQEVWSSEATSAEPVSLDFVVFEYINTDTVEDEVRCTTCHFDY
jgi:hypothetical protein